MIRLQAPPRHIDEIAFAIPVVLFLKIVVMIILSRASDSIQMQPPPQPPPQLPLQLPPRLQRPAQRPLQHRQLQAPPQLQQRPQQELRQHRFNQQAEYQNKLNLGFLSNFLKN